MKFLTHTLVKLLGRAGYTVKKRRPGVRRSVSGEVEAVEPARLMDAIHGADIYEGFEFEKFGSDLQGWGSNSPAFAELIEEVKPKFIVEVGTWKGGSAVAMADCLGKNGSENGVILCIDTWLGALEFWSDQADPERFQALECRHGFPQVYYRFLANVCHAGHQARIVPFPLHSSAAALWLMRNGLEADLIYVDGSHEEEDVYQDLIDFYGLVRKGGILFGDDWAWSGVRAAVERFAGENGIEIRHVHDKWVLGKG